MVHKTDTPILSSAPQSDIELVSNYFKNTCNCYAYAVQDYLAGHLSDQDSEDFSYLPRPGQSRGKSYLDLRRLNVAGMRRAIHEDGINFAGLKYPKVIPDGYYVICCFLEPKEYHFLRQNDDGSWSSKNGCKLPTKCNYWGMPMTNPEDYYCGNKNCKFIGYFFVPQGGIKVGVRAYETNRLRRLREQTRNTPQKQYEVHRLKELVELSDYADQTVREMRRISQREGSDTFSEYSKIWEAYLLRFSDVSKKCKLAGYTRKSILKPDYTRRKNLKKIQSREKMER